MANNRLTYFRSLINRQTREHEVLSEYLVQAEVLAHVAASCKEFADLGEEIINNYAWTLREILYKANKLNDQLLHELVRIRAKKNVNSKYCQYQTVTGNKNGGETL
jgi:hypothetical protein